MQGHGEAPTVRMVVLVGLPGSGKSTMATRLAEQGWLVINQDLEGNRKRCEAKTLKALKGRQDVVIDRCNADVDQRSHWIRMAREFGAHTIAVQLYVDEQECVRRCQLRTGHPSLAPADAPGVIQRFASTYERVGRGEGFAESFRVASDNEIEDMLAYLGRGVRSSRSKTLPALPLPQHVQSPGQLPATVQPGHQNRDTAFPSSTFQNHHHFPSPANGVANLGLRAPVYQPGASQWEHGVDASHSMSLQQPSWNSSDIVAQLDPGLQLPPHLDQRNQTPAQPFEWDPSRRTPVGIVPPPVSSQAQNWHAAEHPARGPYGAVPDRAPGPYAPIAGHWQDQGRVQTPSHAQQHHRAEHRRWDEEGNGSTPYQGRQSGSGYQWAEGQHSNAGGQDSASWLQREMRAAGGTSYGTGAQQRDLNGRTGGLSEFHETRDMLSGRDGARHAGQETHMATQQYEWGTAAMSARAYAAGGTYTQHRGPYTPGYPAATQGLYALPPRPEGNTANLDCRTMGTSAQHMPKKQVLAVKKKEQKKGHVGGKRDAGRIDTRIILLFDLNGTLTSHTSRRGSSGINKVRPGIHHLRRLQGRFQLGIFSSATRRTVDSVIPLLEEAAGAGPPLFDDRDLVLFRDHTVPAPVSHTQSQHGNAWDTCKPLEKWFQRLERVLLVDDDSYKALPGEVRNMVLMPCWDDNDASDTAISLLVDALLETYAKLGPDGDVRTATSRVMNALGQLPTPGSPAVPHNGTHLMLLNNIVPGNLPRAAAASNGSMGAGPAHDGGPSRNAPQNGAAGVQGGVGGRDTAALINDSIAALLAPLKEGSTLNVRAMRQLMHAVGGGDVTGKDTDGSSSPVKKKKRSPQPDTWDQFPRLEPAADPPQGL